MFELHGVEFGYWSRQPVIRSLDLSLGTGLTLVVGPNGSGKSSLLKLLAGVEKPDAGTIRVDGIGLWQREAAARALLAYVSETPDLSPYATVREVLELTARLRRAAEGEVVAALRRVGLERLGDRSVRELSQGQRRRAVLATALIATPANLVLDEPLEAFDRAGRDDLLVWIGERRAAGTVVVVSHDLEPFVGIADHAVAVAEGRCSARALPEARAERITLLEALARGADAPLGAG